MTMRKVKPESMKEMGLEMSKPSSTIYPTVYFDQHTLPEGKDWKIGKTYLVGLKLVMRGQSMRKGRDGKEHGNFDFDIVGIDPGKEVKSSKNRYVEDDE